MKCLFSFAIKFIQYWLFPFLNERTFVCQLKFLDNTWLQNRVRDLTELNDSLTKLHFLLSKRILKRWLNIKLNFMPGLSIYYSNKFKIVYFLYQQPFCRISIPKSDRLLTPNFQKNMQIIFQHLRTRRLYFSRPQK